MHVKRDLFRSRRPMLVAKAIHVFPIGVGVERMVTRRDAALVNGELVRRILNLF